MNLQYVYSYLFFFMRMPYVIKCLDEAGGEDREDHAGDQLQGKAVQPHVHSEDILVNNLMQKISILLRKPT